MTLASLFAGAFIGIGLGIIFEYGGTAGSVDIIARLAHKYVAEGMGKTMFMFMRSLSLSLSYIYVARACIR